MTTINHVNFNFLGVLLVTLATTISASALGGASDIGLPMIQINHDEDDEYPDLQEQVHLDDFFWTGSGDGPPDYVKQIHTGISKGKDVIVKTNTVVATVFVEGHNEVDIPICLDCFPDNGFELPMNFSSNDRRYWLLTVISGFYSAKDTPMLEEKLAKLYRLAFTRQQSKHLGIGNGALSKEPGASALDIKLPPAVDINEKDSFIEKDADDGDGNDDDDDLDDYHEIKRHRRRRKKRRRRRRRQLQTENYPDYNQHQRSFSEIDISYPEQTNQDIPVLQTASTTTTTTTTTTEPSQLAFELFNTQVNNETKEDLLLRHPNNNAPQPAVGVVGAGARAEAGTGTGGSSSLTPFGFKTPAILTDDTVRIVIHNVTQITEEDIQSGGLPNGARAGGDASQDINEKIDDRPLANQTEIIYSVFVGGRPVMAVTAANDMKLVSELEVTSVMGKDIFMKAEPYLREPLATPLAPATRSSDSGFISSFGENAMLIIIGSLVILLLILLLIALLMMGRPKRNLRSPESKRASSRNELLAEKSSPLHEQVIGPPTIPSIPRVKLNEGGIQNLAYENETARTTIPVQVRSRRGSTTSSDNTSDSSVYTPINPPDADLQRMLDEKAATLFEKRKRHKNQYEKSENQDAIYTKVVSERKKDKKHSTSSNTKHKNKRRYLSENRVGSMEDAPNHSSTETTASNESIVEALRPSYENFERTEAYNPHNNYHRNKLLQNRVFTDKVYDSVPDEIPTQAINREIIRALQPSEKSSETGSIGSFLSMASVKSFPKQSLPQPLNRVLEPVFVTYYDNVDETAPPKTSRKQQRSKSPLNEAVAAIERFPEPKAPRSMRVASQSDNPDPGVVGPIVWEIHKKRMASDNDDQDFACETSGSIRDPAETRSHYEGLLEGALQMYSSHDDLPTPLPTKNFTNQRKQTKREYRGKSAGSMDHPRSVSGPRPSTAQPEKTSNHSNHSTQPPSPNMGAWGSGGVHQPLVRPLSAGPFHRPAEPLSNRIASVASEHGSHSANREDLSAAPLIEAIQNELRKFKRDK